MGPYRLPPEKSLAEHWHEIRREVSHFPRWAARCLAAVYLILAVILVAAAFADGTAFGFSAFGGVATFNVVMAACLLMRRRGGRVGND